MNKRILSVFVCCALYYSAQAQDAKGGISADMMQQIKQSYQGTSTDKAIRNAISNNDIRKLALNQDNMKGMDTHFSVKVNSKGITDQKSSGSGFFRILANLSFLFRSAGKGQPVPARHHRYQRQADER